jgi:DNA repair exonuclease SbcCD ATPase subunit
MGLFAWLASLFGKEKKRDFKRSSRAELERFVQSTQQLIAQKTRQRDYLRGEVESLRQEIRFLEARIKENDLGDLTAEDVMQRILDREHILEYKTAEAEDLTEGIQGLALEIQLVQRELQDRDLVHLDEGQLRELSVSRKRRQEERERLSHHLAAMGEEHGAARSEEVKRRLAELKGQKEDVKEEEPSPAEREPSKGAERPAEAE